MQSGINGATQEIQPHQHLIGFFKPGLPDLRRPENVDAANRALYKTANGGGRNPAAAVFGQRRHVSICSVTGMPGNTCKTYQRRSRD
jgi:hypothetical protein